MRVRRIRSRASRGRARRLSVLFVILGFLALAGILAGCSDGGTTTSTGAARPAAKPRTPREDRLRRWRPLPTGQTLYERVCAGCHGTDGRAKFAPVLVGVDPGTIDKAIRESKGSMAGIGDRLADQEITAIVEYAGTLQ
ncbi:MAG: cytochrome c [Thermoleophilia bacterium]|nr:cytochrome c [Thermoleophilia bacterium]